MLAKDILMQPLSYQRDPAVNYHFEEGKAWLEKSASGQNTTALCYAAFEFRLQIERVGLQHWSALKPDGIEAKDILDAGKFKAIENNIYQLAGHQKTLDARYEYARILNDLLKIKGDIVTPKLGKLSNYWHECSVLCHIGSTFCLTSSEMAKTAYEFLIEVRDFLEDQVKGLITIGRLPECGELENKFIAGEITAEELKKEVTKIGLWARFEYNNGRPNESVGEAIPPASNIED
jgi:hypothetical protein